MDRGPSSHLLSWLLPGVGAAVALSALSLPLQPYTGLALQGERVAAVTPDSPAEAAGIRPNDVLRPAAAPTTYGRVRGPLAGARPREELRLRLQRDGETRDVSLTPTSPPDSERRLTAALLAVACGFLLLGGWVWSERRDRLTRVFLLLCLAFAMLLAPLPQGRWVFLNGIHDVVLSGATVFLPALFVHFFALFPESRRTRGRSGAWVSAAYLVGAALFLASSTTLLLQLTAHSAAQDALLLVQTAAALWFAAGLLLALGFFARSYVRARTVDARRRLRVILIGTALGVAPLAGLILVRNLYPDTQFPGERWAVVSTLLIPASFAWATAVHRIFEFRVAVRSAFAVSVLGAGGVLAYLGSDWLATNLWPDLGAGLAGGSLAFVALAAALLGPAQPTLRRLAETRDAPSLEDTERTANGNGYGDSVDRRLAGACASLVESFRLDGCTSLIRESQVWRVAGRCGGNPSVQVPEDAFMSTLHPNRPMSVDELPLDSPDRAWLEAVDVQWVLQVGEEPARGMLLMGRRLTGAWFGTSELREIERFADHLGVALENAALKREVSSHGALDKSLAEAGKIQSQFLPRRVPVYATLDCAAAALACESVGGDYYDFVEGSDRAFTLAVGDARGHGVPAALTLAGVQARFRGEIRRTPRPGELLSALNRELVQLGHPENFVGMVCARFETRTGRFSFANAGLTPPLVRRRNGRVEELKEAGVLLGVSPDAVYPDGGVQLQRGDVAIVYTDGLTEAQRGDELFGVERVCTVLDANAHRRAKDILHALLDGVRAFADQPLDDVTVVVLKQLTNAPSGAEKPARPTPEATRPPLEAGFSGPSTP